MKKIAWRKQVLYALALISIVSILLTWLLSTPLFNSFIKISLRWVILSTSIFILLFCTAMTYLAKLIKEKKLTHSFIANKEENEIVERMKAEQIKQKLETALLQGQKLQAIGTLAGGIAHDFNNIIYAIKGFTEIAREDVEKNTLVYKNLSRALEGAERAQNLIARLLAFGRNQQMDKIPLLLHEAITGILQLLKPTIPASVTLLLINNLPKNCLILANPTQLHQVIVNIIINAVDAMEDEGTITMTLNHVQENDLYLKQFPQLNKAHYCKIEINDTGHGMDKSVLERIFEPFYTTKEVGKGTGLGLAMAYSIIKQHQGEITVSSQLGKGTLFTLLLPEYQTTHMNKEVTYGSYSTSGR
ncbi:MAG: virA [Gammaproteobacteria bacterium]|jgi:signal transduction histidine kinase|nr:virA [Gammaproteobacteria bacterium]